MRALVFCRHDGAGGRGHVGWGYQSSRTTFVVGGVENESGWPAVPPGMTGFWQLAVDDPYPPMKQREYDSYCVIEVARANPDAALAQGRKVWDDPYFVAGFNCMDATYRILKSYGAPLPSKLWPIDNWFPNLWFDALPDQRYQLPHGRPVAST